MTESREALRELIAVLQEVDERWAGPEWNLQNELDVADAHRALAHLLEGGLVGFFENDPDSPFFRRIVTPTRKLMGDNPDAIYFDAPVRPDRVYRVRGNTEGAVYVSFTVEIGSDDGSLPPRTAGVLNDTQFDVAADGSFEIRVGGPPDDRNWLGLEAGASRITTRHYFEDAATDPHRRPPLVIEPLEPAPAPPRPSAASVGAGWRRVAQFLRSRTLDQPPMANSKPPPFVSLVPNQFPAPVPPGDFGLAAADAAYSMAPYVLGPDQALVIRGSWPRCRFANVCLWNRHMQTYDYTHRQVSLNRRQTPLDDAGRFEVVVAHRDPGRPGWLDTEERPFGLVFWRYMLAEGEIETPQAEVVPFASLGTS
ncbi:MAG: hypothetical protein MJE66_18590 [Proteobacteria bacterium]|nr:hypothetical protein [Pseudomonadota bacterium]